MYTVTITKVETGFKIEPTSHVASNLEEVHRWVRANFQVTPDEWSELRKDLDMSGKASIQRSAGKGWQIS
jgi:hypothetical protein